MSAIEHPDLLRELPNYLDGQISAELRAEIERHIADCENCRVVDTLRKTVELYRRLPPALPETAREQLYKTLALSEYFHRSHSPDKQ
jgi:anti-sigma factor RsiW